MVVLMFHSLSYQAFNEGIQENASQMASNYTDNQVISSLQRHHNSYNLDPDTHIPMNNHQTCPRGLGQPSMYKKRQSISDNSQKADDVRQGRTQVSSVSIIDKLAASKH